MLTKYYLLVYVEFAKVGINIKEHKEHIHNGSRKTNINIYDFIECAR